MLKNCPHCGAANRERANDCYVCESPLPEYSHAEPEPLEDPRDIAVYPDGRVADGRADLARDVSADLARDILENIPDSLVAAAPTAPSTRSVYPDGRAADGRASITEFRPVASRASVALADEPAPAAPPSEPAWKREVASKLEEYRSRRQRTGEDSQSALPFSEAAAPAAESEAQPNPRESLRLSARSRPQPAEPVSIAAQPELDFDSESQPTAQQLTNRLVPVAQLRDRLHAGLLDAGFLIITYGGFLLMFASLGNPLTFGKVETAVYAAALFLIYGLYITLFTAFGAATPGMLLRNLHAVSFDGHPPSPQQMLWRSFGYLVSAAAGLLGFAWSLWDEDHLTWHDRISQTYLTEASPAPHSAGLSSSASSGSSSQSYKIF